ncbi:MAG: DUF58 domain-containing protein [Steroidobacteraceae bacterium]
MSTPSLSPSLATRITRGVARWSRRRHGVDSSPVELTHRRIYILPTRLGLVYAIAVLAMGLGGMNYGNNLALMLAFLLAALGFVAMHHCHRNLAGLRIHSLANEPVFAGQLAYLQLAVENPSPQIRFDILAETEQHQATPVQATIAAQTPIQLPIASTTRGWLRLERLSLSTRYPFGLFRGWTVLHLDLKCLIYPRPSERSNTPPPTQFDSRHTQDLQRGDDEFAGFRSFHPGDSPNRIAWKAYAREQGLLIKQFAGASVATCVLDWDALAGLDAETRLSRLCRWVIDSHQQGIAYGLKLPGFNAAPALSEAHRTRCLSALALFQGRS